jgi:N-dimethylarginine dimethylaminohydrolase
MPAVFAKTYPANEVHFSLDDCDNRTEPRKVLLCTPDYFDVKDVRNVHMHGNKGNVNPEKAAQQWDNIRNIYLDFKNKGFLDEVHVIDGVEDCEDMVFCANQSFPWVMWNSDKIVIMSRMKHVSRQKEIPYYQDFYEDEGYKIIHLESKYHFEGMGDLLAHPLKKLLYGGYGFRTDKNVYEEISRITDAPIITLELINNNFYHLDTCFLPLNQAEVIIAPRAFSAESLNIIRKMFEGVYEIPEEEALAGFACNAHIIYETTKRKQAAIIQRNNPETLNIIQQNAAIVAETDTSEFAKSGGSVFCMKMMVY